MVNVNPDSKTAYYLGYITGRIILWGTAFFLMKKLTGIIPAQNKAPQPQPNSNGGGQ